MEHCGDLVCLDRKGGTLTLDPSPPFYRECVCVFILLHMPDNRFFFRHWSDGQMVLVVMAAYAGAYVLGFLPQGA